MTAGAISTVRNPSSRVGLDTSGLRHVGAKANVAFDMFLDPVSQHLFINAFVP